MINEPGQSERQDRLAKLDKIKALAIKPYPAKCGRDCLIAEALVKFDELLNTQQSLTLAGRLRSWREHGNICFADL